MSRTRTSHPVCRERGKGGIYAACPSSMEQAAEEIVEERQEAELVLCPIPTDAFKKARFIFVTNDSTLASSEESIGLSTELEQVGGVAAVFQRLFGTVRVVALETGSVRHIPEGVFRTARVLGYSRVSDSLRILFCSEDGQLLGKHVLDVPVDTDYLLRYLLLILSGCHFHLFDTKIESLLAVLDGEEKAWLRGFNETIVALREMMKSRRPHALKIENKLFSLLDGMYRGAVGVLCSDSDIAIYLLEWRLVLCAVTSLVSSGRLYVGSRLLNAQPLF